MLETSWADKREGTTQQQLAEDVGCTRQTILLLEQGRDVPSLALAFRIARRFEKSLEEVFELVE